MFITFILEMIFCFMASLFFAMIMNAPKKTLIHSSMIASVGYLVYIFFVNNGNQKLGFFLGTTVVAFLGEINARRFKMPATIFIFPGVIPIVPGLGLYQTLFALVEDNISAALETGVNTFLNIGAMAVAMALVSLAALKIGSRKTE